MRSDIERWNRKYLDRDTVPSAPDPLLLDYAHCLRDRGAALDVACGLGHNALYLARRGYEVYAVDGSEVALGRCRAALRRAPLPVHLIVADLDGYTPPTRYFDLVLVVSYLHRPLLPRLCAAVKPGGLLLYKTFNMRRLETTPRFPRDYLLEPGELARYFRDWETIATNDDPTPSADIAFWIGRRPQRD